MCEVLIYKDLNVLEMNRRLFGVTNMLTEGLLGGYKRVIRMDGRGMDGWVHGRLYRALLLYRDENSAPRALSHLVFPKILL